MRAILPTLTQVEFRCASEYLENLVARIDAAPLLDCLQITLLKQPKFYSPHLCQFISRVPKFQALSEARVIASYVEIWVAVPSSTPSLGHNVLGMGISPFVLNSQLSPLVLLCTLSLPLFPMLEHLYLASPRGYGQNQKRLSI